MSSKRRLRRNSCGLKVKYETKDAATQAAIWYHRHFGDWMNVYRCRFCKKFHIGHG